MVSLTAPTTSKYLTLEGRSNSCRIFAHSSSKVAWQPISIRHEFEAPVDGNPWSLTRSFMVQEENVSLLQTSPVPNAVSDRVSLSSWALSSSRKTTAKLRFATSTNVRRHGVQSFFCRTCTEQNTGFFGVHLPSLTKGKKLDEDDDAERNSAQFCTWRTAGWRRSIDGNPVDEIDRTCTGRRASAKSLSTPEGCCTHWGFVVTLYATVAQRRSSSSLLEAKQKPTGSV